jgi:hypothetical protein
MVVLSQVAAKKERAGVREVEKNMEEEGREVISSVAKKAGKGAAKRCESSSFVFCPED